MTYHSLGSESPYTKDIEVKQILEVILQLDDLSLIIN